MKKHPLLLNVAILCFSMSSLTPCQADEAVKAKPVRHAQLINKGLEVSFEVPSGWKVYSMEEFNKLTGGNFKKPVQVESMLFFIIRDSYLKDGKVIKDDEFPNINALSIKTAGLPSLPTTDEETKVHFAQSVKHMEGLAASPTNVMRNCKVVTRGESPAIEWGNYDKTSGTQTGHGLQMVVNGKLVVLTCVASEKTQFSLVKDAFKQVIESFRLIRKKATTPEPTHSKSTEKGAAAAQLIAETLAANGSPPRHKNLVERQEVIYPVVHK